MTDYFTEETSFEAVRVRGTFFVGEDRFIKTSAADAWSVTAQTTVPFAAGDVVTLVLE